MTQVVNKKTKAKSEVTAAWLENLQKTAAKFAANNGKSYDETLSALLATRQVKAGAPKKSPKLRKQKRTQKKRRLKQRDKIRLINESVMLQARRKLYGKKKGDGRPRHLTSGKTASLARNHPLGRLIGGTEVTTYKSGASNVRWATPRKRPG